MSKKSRPKGPDGRFISKDAELANSLSSLATQIRGPAGSAYPGIPAGAQQASNPNTLILNLRNYLISNNRVLLNNLYVEIGLIQALIDLPVDDGFSKGFEIKTGQLDADDIEILQNYWEEQGVGDELIQSVKWARLFGGGGLLVITDQPANEPLDIDAIDEDTPLKFRATDIWELYNAGYTGQEERSPVIEENPPHYNFYGTPVHPSRVMTIKGKRAPSYSRSMLRGWGMSEVERIVRSLNQFLKNTDVIFALLDEAKIDVYGIQDLNSSLLSANGTAAVAMRVQMANLIKNFVNALVMDKDDTYEQKIMQFPGMADMLREIRIGMASDVRIPMTKLFGQSAAGFSSGEDDIENYNAMIQSSVRSPTKFHIVTCLKICCRKLFGFAPDDLMIKWPSLRILSAKEEEEVKDSQFARVMDTWQAGGMTDEEFKENLNAASLLPQEIDVSAPVLAPPGMPEGGAGEDEEEGGKGKGGASNISPFKVRHARA